MGYENLFTSLRFAIRDDDFERVDFHLNRLMKKSADTATEPLNRSAIDFEIAKVLRLLNRESESVRVCERAMENIPANAAELLAAFGRLRALLYLDGEEYSSARSLIDTVDGLHLVIGERTLTSRNDAEVTTQTWLVSVEIALAAADFELFDVHFKNAENAFEAEREKFAGNNRLSPKQIKEAEIYTESLRQILKMYELAANYFNDQSVFAELFDYYKTICAYNDRIVESGNLPNMIVQAKLSCIVSPTGDVRGISEKEADRWRKYSTYADYRKYVQNRLTAKPDSLGEETSIAVRDKRQTIVPNEYVDNNRQLPINTRHADLSLQIMEKLDSVAGSIKEAAQAINVNREKSGITDYERRSFGGHLRDNDLITIFQIAAQLRFTGVINCRWHPDLFKPDVFAGRVPETALGGHAVLYSIDGVLTDCVFGAQWGAQTAEAASDNLVLLVQLAFATGLSAVNNLIADTEWSEAVRDRPCLLNIQSQMDLIDVLTSIEERVGGISDNLPNNESGDKWFDDGANNLMETGENIQPESFRANNPVMDLLDELESCALFDFDEPAASPQKKEPDRVNNQAPNESGADNKDGSNSFDDELLLEI